MTELSIDGMKLKGFNVTVVYERLPLSAISRDALRAIRVGDEDPVLLDVPEQVVGLIYRQGELQATFGNRRLSVTRQKPAGLGEDARIVAVLTARAMDAVPEAVPIPAFGFNYDIDVLVKGVDSVGALVRDRFIARRDELESTVGGTLARADVALSFERDGSECHVRLRQSLRESGTVDVHVNVHFAGRQAPADDTLGDEIVRHFERAVTTLRRLIGVDREVDR
ncbi:MAG: hypothetical protein HY691_01225 [Chloroflexi bacterium]|nr:hypothetical protein [Chloroflexota bacterium]